MAAGRRAAGRHAERATGDHGWQRGHQKLRRASSPWRRDRTVVPHRRQGRPARPSRPDLRALDGLIALARVQSLVEAKTRLADLQATERKIRLKQRDSGIGRCILLLAETRHNRDVVRATPSLRHSFPRTLSVQGTPLRVRESGPAFSVYCGRPRRAPARDPSNRTSETPPA